MTEGSMSNHLGDRSEWNSWEGQVKQSSSKISIHNRSSIFPFYTNEFVSKWINEP